MTNEQTREVERAVRLRAFMDECRRVLDESFPDLEIDLDANPPNVPFRFVTNEYSEDRDNTYLHFADTLEEARDHGVDGAYNIVDLDTGDRWEIHLLASVVPLEWHVKTTSRLSNAINVTSFPTQERAQGYVEAVEAVPDGAESFITVLDGPFHEWHMPKPEQSTARELAERMRAFVEADSEADRERFINDALALARLVLESEAA